MSQVPRVVKTEKVVPTIKEIQGQPADSSQKPRVVKTEQVKPDEGTAEKHQ